MQQPCLLCLVCTGVFRQKCTTPAVFFFCRPLSPNAPEWQAFLRDLLRPKSDPHRVRGGYLLVRLFTCLRSSPALGGGELLRAVKVPRSVSDPGFLSPEACPAPRISEGPEGALGRTGMLPAGSRTRLRGASWMDTGHASRCAGGWGHWPPSRETEVETHPSPEISRARKGVGCS